MDLVTVAYILNATLLLLHELDSAYEKEWEILRLPGGITGFLLLHIPLVALLFYGALELAQHTRTGLTLGIITGIGGLVPFIVHKLLVKRLDRFNRTASNAVIFLNILTGLATVALSLAQ